MCVSSESHPEFVGHLHVDLRVVICFVGGVSLLTLKIGVFNFCVGAIVRIMGHRSYVDVQVGDAPVSVKPK